MVLARSLVTSILVLACLAAAVPATYAQNDRGMITGQVTDQSGAIITGATVKGVHVATNFARTVTTSREGSYTIPQLPVGGYVVVVTAVNFQTTTLDNVEVTAGSTVRVDARLAIGGLQDSVTVASDSRQIQTDSVKVTTAISSKFIQDLPLVVGGQLRSPLDLSLIAPEAKTGTGGDGGRGNIVIGGGQEGGWDLSVWRAADASVPVQRP
ncbi:MAG: carboxypeptidase-like regulatory domain-containing protein [Vicinamibacterales bacterium]